MKRRSRSCHVIGDVSSYDTPHLPVHLTHTDTQTHRHTNVIPQSQICIMAIHCSIGSVAMAADECDATE